MAKENVEEEKVGFRVYILSLIILACIAAQIVLTFTLWDNYYNLDVVLYIGYALWVLGAIFGVIPIFHFKNRGDVGKGESYMKTKKIVTSGLYVIVRHPQYLSGILISIALACMSQHWLVDILILPPIIFTYIDAKREDRKLIKKFGEEYIEYMKKVPGLEPISGIIRWVIRTIKKRKEI